MVIEFNVNRSEGLVNVIEETEYGTKKNKLISLDEFLEIYTSCIKETEDKYDFLFLPPGTINFRKKMNSVCFLVETYPYKEYYGVKNNEYDYVVLMNTNSSGDRVLSCNIYATKGAFNKHFSSFAKIFESKKSFIVKDESEGIKKCLSECKNLSLDNIKLSLKYKDII